MSPPAQPPLPAFEVRLGRAGHRSAGSHGNTGCAASPRATPDAPGPHVALLALVHGNEIAGAIVLDRLLRAGLAPRADGSRSASPISTAFERFDPRQPTASRFIDEDLNRVWDPAVLDGPRRSAELDRARAMRPLIESVDVLLDLHSMLWPSDPLLLCGTPQKGSALAQAIGTPPLVVADTGHATGPRLIDYPGFGEAAPAAAPPWWRPGSTGTKRRSRPCSPAIAGLLRHRDRSPAIPPCRRRRPPHRRRASPRSPWR